MIEYRIAVNIYEAGIFFKALNNFGILSKIKEYCIEINSILLDHLQTSDVQSNSALVLTNLAKL